MSVEPVAVLGSSNAISDGGPVQTHGQRLSTIADPFRTSACPFFPTARDACRSCGESWTSDRGPEFRAIAESYEKERTTPSADLATGSSANSIRASLGIEGSTGRRLVFALVPVRADRGPMGEEMMNSACSQAGGPVVVGALDNATGCLILGYYSTRDAPDAVSHPHSSVSPRPGHPGSPSSPPGANASRDHSKGPRVGRPQMPATIPSPMRKSTAWHGRKLVGGEGLLRSATDSESS